MKALYLQHVPFEGPAYLSHIMAAKGIPLNGCALYQYQSLPEMNEFDIFFIMGGPMNVYDEKHYSWLKDEKKFIEASIKNNKKIIGICLGAQLIADVLGASITKNDYKEIGWFPVNRIENAVPKINSIFPDTFYAFHWHGDTFELPRNAIHLAKSEACKNQAFLYNDHVLGLQFHLESTETSINELFENAKDELDGSSFVQKQELILDKRYIHSSNQLMKQVVSFVAAI